MIGKTTFTSTLTYLQTFTIKLNWLKLKKAFVFTVAFVGLFTQVLAQKTITIYVDSALGNTDNCTKLYNTFTNELQIVFSKQFEYTKTNKKNTRAGRYCIELNKSQSALLKPHGYTIVGDSLKKIIKISSPTIDGIYFGIYSYLEELGFRWYFPDPNKLWNVYPLRETNLFKNITKKGTPKWANRTIAQGLLSPYAWVDKDNSRTKVYNDWNNWIYKLGNSKTLNTVYENGTVNFLIKFKTEIHKHPSWLALIDNKRALYNIDVKLCFSNDTVLNEFIKYKLAVAKELSISNLKENFCISVDPSDGYGFCECSKCKKIGTISDLQFSVANSLGNTLKKNNIHNVFINIFAYSAYVQPPKCNIADNVIVTLVPYGYTNNKYTDELFRQNPINLRNSWLKKVRSKKQLVLYDYFGLNVCMNMPIIDYKERLGILKKDWFNYDILGIVIETDFNIGTNGLPIYVFSKQMWNSEVDADSIIDEFCINMFPNTKRPMKSLFKRWFKGVKNETSLGSLHTIKTELPLIKQNLIDASIDAKDPLEIKRLNQIKEYFHYLILVDKYLDAFLKNEPDRLIKRNELLDFAWRLHFHNYFTNAGYLQIRIAEIENTIYKDNSIENLYDLNVSDISKIQIWNSVYKEKGKTVADLNLLFIKDCLYIEQQNNKNKY